MSSILENPSVRRVALPISVAQYHRLGEAAIIPQNTELLRGVIVEKMIKSPRHSWVVQFLVNSVTQSVDARFCVRQEQPLTLDDSEPEPDVAVVEGSADDFRDAHPNRALLVMEVAISSVDVDREKAELYAAAAISEYWLILPAERSVDVYTEPTPSGYQRRQSYAADQIVVSKVLAALAVDLRQLFA